MQTEKDIAQYIRYWILKMTTEAGSGHPTSSLSAVELMLVLFSKHFRFKANSPNYENNDRLIFSKGHASPLFYALWSLSGVFPKEELLTLRKFGSRLEGHPTMKFPFTEAATGSLGQGLAIGTGEALAAKMNKLDYQTYVLLGDGEMMEGSNWEAAAVASHYKLNNLTAIVDVSRLEQSGESLDGWHLHILGAKFKAFGWEAILIADGNDVSQVQKAFEERIKIKKGVPVVLIAKTVKGKGVSFLENKPNWHGKALDKTLLAKALKEIGQPQKEIRVELATPLSTDGDLGEVSRKLEKLIGPQPKAKTKELEVPKTELKCDYKLNELKATRKAYGEALLQLVESDDRVIVLDAGMDNSTFSELVKEKYPDRFLQMYIAEQTMVGVALGLSRRGWRPYLSTFAAFLTRAHDQIRMSRYSEGNLKIMGSHAGVSMGADGSSQMGLEDIAMFRSVPEAVILYPADAVAMHKLVGVADKHKGMVYLRASRPEVPVIYKNTEKFVIGGSKALKQSPKDMVTIVAAGITLHEALKAYEELKKQRITVRVIDLYSVKPLDVETLKAALFETQAIITVEDHYKEGGLGEAVAAALADSRGKVYSLAVTKLPQSGTPAELLDYEEISAQAIVEKVKKVIFG